MFASELHLIRPHDLLEIDATQFIASQTLVPEWAKQNLQRTPFVVVRRRIDIEPNIPIGVRGGRRDRRWAASCHPKLVKRAIAPPELLRRKVPESRAATVSALRSLELLETLWMDLGHSWGPGGSVGFELATGTRTAKRESDLDIVIYAERRLTVEEATLLCESAKGLPAAVDIRVETRFCGFALQEYASQTPARILLRTLSGFMLGSDPWDGSGLPDTIGGAAPSSTI
jgi:phosphoribosyl-dephospho-CoA transferase